MSSSNLPPGWHDRKNQMSSKDMKLGGIAANKFTNKNLKSSAYDGTNEVGYKTSDQVRSFYYSQQEHQKQQQTEATLAFKNVPIGWEERQKTRQLESKQHGVFASRSSSANPLSTGVPIEAIGHNINSTERKEELQQSPLMKVTINTLNVLAESLQTSPITKEEQAEFANAVRRVMQVMTKSHT